MGTAYGFTQGVFAALAAEASPAELRGTASGVFNLVTGVTLLVARVLAGTLWTVYGAPGMFVAGAALSLLCLISLVPLRAASKMA